MFFYYVPDRSHRERVTPKGGVSLHNGSATNGGVSVRSLVLPLSLTDFRIDFKVPDGNQ